MRRGVLVLAAVLVVALAASASARADSLTPLCNGVACGDGWYGSPVTVTWQVDPPTSNTSDCAEILPSDQNLVASTSCQATWLSGQASMTYTVHVELTNPTVTASVPPPSPNGWYTHPVTVTFSGSSFSGISSCTGPTTYSGGTISGSCMDNAGKVATTTVWLPNYDTTPPTILGARASRPPDHHGWYTKPVSFTFTGTDSGSGISRCQVVRYSGSASGVVTGGCWDRAGNYASIKVRVAFLHVVARRYVARLTPVPLLLRWRSARHATYYNVQLFRGNRKLLSRWPSGSSLFLSRAWRFDGREFRLKPGRYRWYVWPGYGSRRADQYGRSIMAATFTVL